MFILLDLLDFFYPRKEVRQSEETFEQSGILEMYAEENW